MNSKTATQIKQRTTPKDVFITPRALAKTAIDMAHNSLPENLHPMKFNYWYDPFRNSAEGSYYSQFPRTNNKLPINNNDDCEGMFNPIHAKCWAEITEGRDFFTHEPVGDMMPARLIICSNPPYSMLDKVFQRCIELKPVVINLLIGVNNLTARRMEMMEKAGYKLTKLHMCKVYKWFGMSFICNWVKGAEGSCLSYDRTVWRNAAPALQ